MSPIDRLSPLNEKPPEASLAESEHERHIDMHRKTRALSPIAGEMSSTHFALVHSPGNELPWTDLHGPHTSLLHRPILDPHYPAVRRAARRVPSAAPEAVGEQRGRG